MIGILLMAYGTPATLDDVEAYYTHIRGGRKPSPEHLEELLARYKAIGGRSPLLEITQRQAAGLEATLNRETPGTYRVYVGMRHAPPFIADVVVQMVGDRPERAIGVALAPHYSRMSIAAYIAAARKALEEWGSPFPMEFVETWHDNPLYLDALAARVREALGRFPSDERPHVPVVFTAHSLPQKILEWNDPYPRELQRTCEGVAQRAGVTPWSFAYQSAGRTADPWLGPDITEKLRSLYEEGGRAVVFCPVGFVADHLEVLYDIDVNLRQMARAMGVRLERAPSLNDSPDFVATLADVVRRRAAA
ncbi:MAG: ferrochelatase [Armatimonadetes bacterium]|nr:ferrochelatase [Armatimonadota bacterium]